MKRGNKKLIIIIFTIIVILFITLIVLLNISKKNTDFQNRKEQIMLYKSIDDFKTIEEVAIFLDCKYIKEEKSKSENYNTDIYMEIKYEPYSEEISNEKFYDNLISYCANVLNYKSFRIIDKKMNITIEVSCNNQTQKIKEILINGENNYFEKHNSYIELSRIKQEKEVDFQIQSTILKNLIKNGWDSNIEEIGKSDTTFRKYDIYFKQGIEIRKIDGKIFNIIFTKNYKENIVNNIKTTSSKDELINALGEPTFADENTQCIGYKGKDMYLFYNSQNEISVYRVDNNFNSEEFIKLVDQYIKDGEAGNFTKNVKNKYTNFDKYIEDENGVFLQYALNGLAINFRNIENKGITIYNNYIGDFYNDLDIEKAKNNKEIPNEINIINKNLVEQTEYERITELEIIKENANMEEYDNKNQSRSNKYYTIKTLMEDDSYKIEFISKDGSGINSELRQNINYFIWLDDYNFVYGIKNNGMYIYNLLSRKYATLITGKDEFKIKEFKNNEIKYDEKSLKIKY